MRSRSSRAVIRMVSGVAIFIVIAGGIVSYLVAGSLVAPNLVDVGDAPGDLPAEEILIESDSGATLAGWHIRSNEQIGVVVLLHSYRGSRLTMLERARLLYREGYSLVMIDFQAHGESPGNQITLGHLERHDARAAVDFAKREHPEEPVGVIAVSLGGAAALLASPLGIDALVLESVFPSIDEAVHNRVSARLGLLSAIPAEILLAQLNPRLGVSRSELRPADSIGSVDCPVFLLSGTDDRHTTAEEAVAMFARAKEPKDLHLVERAGHVDLYQAAGKDYKRRVVTFLETWMRPGH